MTHDQETVVLTKPLAEFEAQLIRSFLESNGVEAVVVGGTFESLWGVSISSTGGTSLVYVNVNDRERAIELLSVREGDVDASGYTTCPVCRYDLEGIADVKDTCPECGVSLSGFDRMRQSVLATMTTQPNAVRIIGPLGCALVLGAIAVIAFLIASRF